MNDVERRKKIKEFVAYWSQKDILKKADAEEANADAVGANAELVGADTIRPNIGERKEYQNFWNMIVSTGESTRHLLREEEILVWN